MKLRTITKPVIAGLILNGLAVGNVFANNISDDRYEYFESESVVINNVLEQDSIDMEVEGKTLVNVVYDEYYKNDGGISSGYVVENGFNSEITQGNGSLVVGKKAVLKDNTVYTLICDINTSLSSVSYTFANEENFSQGALTERVDFSSGYHRVVKTLTTTTNCTDIGVGNHSAENPAGTYLNVKNLMLLEGDWTNREIPEHFEGIQSVGEDKNNKIAITSSNKNLLNWDETTITNRADFINKNMSYTINDDKSITFNGVSSTDTTDLYLHGKWESNVPIMRLNKGAYTLSIDKNIPYNYFTIYLLNYSDVIGWSNNSRTFTLDKPADVTAIMIRCENGATYNNTTIYPMLELSDFETDYKPHEENRVNIDTKEPLRGISDSIRDRIVKINGKWYIERKCGEIKGPDVKKVTVSQSNELYTKIRLEDLAKVRVNNGNSPILTNKFKIGAPAGWELKMQDEVVEPVFTLAPSESGYNNHRGMLYLTLSRDKATTADEAKEWINNSDLRIVYELAEPKFEKININLSLPLYKGTTHIYTDSNIPANIKVVIDRTINRATEAIELAKMNPTVENIALARMWTNLLKDSAIKDRLEDSISDITNIVDMTIEKKKVTANLDMYIKPENSISMSLSANSITFDNYTGLEDMEKLGALDITINSSLPYDLNAYMPKELSNADGSNTMGVNILNIRDNTQIAYSQFVNTTDKVVLKSDCDKGNNKQHTIDLKIASDRSFKPDIYKAVIKFEAEQK